MQTRRYITVLLTVGSLAAVSGETREQLIQYLDNLAGAQLQQRQQAISRIHSRADADRRKAMVRQKILQLIGGLPLNSGPVPVKQFGSLAGDGFSVEKLAYESLPGFWVTANVYLPAEGNGPFPAIVIAPGHGAAGKVEDWSWGGNFARNGIAVLAYDPLGQGERLQYFDPEKKASKIGGPTGEHGEANIPPLLIGDDLARYMVNDAMRAVDYLVGRKDIDANRIGAFGCSGGGTATAYFAALDPRVKAAASACFITAFQNLLASPTGNQDAEQTIPHFVEQGFDFADWVELFAPKPYAIVSTTDDMFPFEGAKKSYEEAKRFYLVYGAGDRIQWLTGPGRHGNLIPIAPAILSFFTKNLKGSDAPATFTALRLEHREDLQCTPTGQVLTSLDRQTLGSETVYSINRKRAEGLMAPQQALANKADVGPLQTRVREYIQTFAAAQPGGPPPDVAVKSTEPRDGYKLETITIPIEGGAEIEGMIASPDVNNARAVVLLLGEAGDAMDRLARSGYAAMSIETRPSPPGTESIKSPYLGIYNLLSLRAFLVGQTIIGLRLDDAIHAVNWLAGRKEMKGYEITVFGSGPSGLVALHAAALDPRIARVVVKNTLADYRSIIDQPLHSNVSEVVIPGVLRKYDTGDLMLATWPRPIVVVNPCDALGAAMSEAEFRKREAYVFQADRNLRSPMRIHILSLKPDDPSTKGIVDAR